MIASIGIAPAFGQIVQPIVVTTDKTSYSDGDPIMVTGQISETLFGYAISIEVLAPNGNRVAIEQVMPGSDKTYSAQFTAGGSQRSAEDGERGLLQGRPVLSPQRHQRPGAAPARAQGGHSASDRPFSRELQKVERARQETGQGDAGKAAQSRLAR